MAKVEIVKKDYLKFINTLKKQALETPVKLDASFKSRLKTTLSNTCKNVPTLFVVGGLDKKPTILPLLFNNKASLKAFIKNDDLKKLTGLELAKTTIISGLLSKQNAESTNLSFVTQKNLLKGAIALKGGNKSKLEQWFLSALGFTFGVASLEVTFLLELYDNLESYEFTQHNSLKSLLSAQKEGVKKSEALKMVSDIEGIFESFNTAYEELDDVTEDLEELKNEVDEWFVHFEGLTDAFESKDDLEAVTKKEITQTKIKNMVKDILVVFDETLSEEELLADQNLPEETYDEDAYTDDENTSALEDMEEELQNIKKTAKVLATCALKIEKLIQNAIKLDIADKDFIEEIEDLLGDYFDKVDELYEEISSFSDHYETLFDAYYYFETVEELNDQVTTLLDTLKDISKLFPIFQALSKTRTELVKKLKDTDNKDFRESMRASILELQEKENYLQKSLHQLYKLTDQWTKKFINKLGQVDKTLIQIVGQLDTLIQAGPKSDEELTQVQMLFEKGEKLKAFLGAGYEKGGNSFQAIQKASRQLLTMETTL